MQGAPGPRAVEFIPRVTNNRVPVEFCAGANLISPEGELSKPVIVSMDADGLDGF